MRQHRTIKAAGVAAQHCAALMPAAPTAEDNLAALEHPTKRLSRLLPPALAPLCGDAAPALEIEAARIVEAGALLDRIGPLAANAVVDDGAGAPAMLLSADAKAVFAQLDRAFGGAGEAPDALPVRFPVSAELLIAGVHDALLPVIAEALGLPGAPQIIARCGELSDFEPAIEQERFALLAMTFVDAKGARFALTLALTLPFLARLAQRRDGAAHLAAAQAAGPLDAPYCDIPLRLDARLVDMRVPLRALGDLAPGVVLPVAVARHVPIAIGETIIGFGALGEQDDRVALRLCQQLAPPASHPISEIAA